MSFKFDKVKGTLVYVQVQQAVKAYQKAGTDAKPDEWKASVVVTDEDFVDGFEDALKEVDAKVSLAKVKSVDFADKYKCDPPEGAGKNVWVFTFRKSTELGKTGKPVPEQFRPKVYEKVGSVLVDVTNSKLPANGSKGVVSLEVFERTNGSASLYLKNVLVTDMIEYIKKESDYVAGSEFEDEVDAKVSKSEGKPKDDAPKKAKAKVPVEDEELDDTDLPF